LVRGGVLYFVALYFDPQFALRNFSLAQQNPKFFI